jgi:hypothetical protein
VRLFALFLLLFSCFYSKNAQADPDWQVYANADFGFSGCYQSKIFTPQSPPTDGDGLMFRSKAGAVVRMFGAYNALSQTPDQILPQDRAALLGGSNVPTYQFLHGDYFVFSGIHGAQIVYEKTKLVGDKVITLQITYPKSQAAVYDPLTSAMSVCFRVEG